MAIQAASIRELGDQSEAKASSPAVERFRQLASQLPECGENYGYTPEEMDELAAQAPSSDHQPG